MAPAFPQSVGCLRGGKRRCLGDWHGPFCVSLQDSVGPLPKCLPCVSSGCLDQLHLLEEVSSIHLFFFSLKKLFFLLTAKEEGTGRAPGVLFCGSEHNCLLLSPGSWLFKGPLALTALLPTQPDGCMPQQSSSHWCLPSHKALCLTVC